MGTMRTGKLVLLLSVLNVEPDYETYPYEDEESEGMGGFRHTK
jgi:hypothetical protein